MVGSTASPEAILKKSLFPVLRMAMIVVSQEAAKSFFFLFSFFSLLYRIYVVNAEKKGKISRM